MKILSLYDGMSCGMLAFIAAGIPVDEYHTYEINKYAIETSKRNFPDIVHHGDVLSGDFTAYNCFDFLIGGSPCTYWSIAQNPAKRETVAIGIGWELFQQYVRALEESKPDFFIYENNKSMSNAIRDSITQSFGFEPICIDSALVSAQSRKRLYWVGKRIQDGTYTKVNVNQPDDKGILLKDVLDSMEEPLNADMHGKSRTIKAQYSNTSFANLIRNDNLAASGKAIQIGHIGKSNAQANRVYSVNGKSVTLKANGGGGGAKTGLYKVDLPDGDYIFRKLSVNECKRLQTVPEWYEFPVSDTRAYMMLGNGWTVDVIAHLIKSCTAMG